jgi:hypothetical protein
MDTSRPDRTRSLDSRIGLLRRNLSRDGAEAAARSEVTQCPNRHRRRDTQPGARGMLRPRTGITGSVNVKRD